MPLETPSDDDLRITDVLLDPEDRIERPSAALYRAIVSTFYNREKGVWKDGVKASGEEVESGEGMMTDVQLFEVLAEDLYNHERAAAMFRSLKEGPHFSREHVLWNWSVDTGADSMTGKEFSSSTQLLGILCEAQSDPASARRGHERLLQSLFRDADKKQWLGFLRLDPRGRLHVDDDKCYCDAQLLGVWAEFLFNPAAAKESFERFRVSNLRESAGEHRWQFAVKKDGALGDAEDCLCLAENQLLGARCEALFDRSQGSMMYRGLTKGAFHDPVLKQWVNASSDSDRMTSAQLLSVLCEHLFEEEAFERAKHPRLPILRSF